MLQFKKNLLIFLVILFFTINCTVAQAVNVIDNDFVPPVELPLFLSGNFAELRSNHFHAGIDIKTQGVIGHRVVAIDSGFISRVKVSSSGYGNAVYIQHYNGYTSVYGHLHEFFDELAEYVKTQQYAKKKFNVDLYLKKEQFQVSKGQLIALSGNTGYSGGPHVHFEIRRNEDQVPLNVLQFGFEVKDTLPPVFKRLALYDLQNELLADISDKVFLSLTGSNGVYNLKEEVINVPKTLGIGTEVYDFLNGSNNKCGVYKLKLYYDGVLKYSFILDEVPFDKTRYINAHMDFEEKRVNKKNIHKLFIEPGNRLKIYDEKLGNGILSFTDTLVHDIKIEAYDVYENLSSLEFKAKANFENLQDTNIHVLYYKHTNIFDSTGFSINIPQGALYNNVPVNFAFYTNEEEVEHIYNIGVKNVSLHKYASMSLPLPVEFEDNYEDKVVVVLHKGEGKVSSLGGEVNGKKIYTLTRELGEFSVRIDTVPPIVKPLRDYSIGTLMQGASLRFEITDDLSGIKTYNGYINGDWALFEYDAKNDLLNYTLDDDRLGNSTTHELKVFVMDERNNVSVYETKFNY